jgi:hypothetical protein
MQIGFITKIKKIYATLGLQIRASCDFHLVLNLHKFNAKT